MRKKNPETKKKFYATQYEKNYFYLNTNPSILKKYQIIETENAMVKDLMDRGYSKMQLYGMRILPVIPLTLQNKMFNLEPDT